MPYEELLNKNILVIKTDGYKKYGLLLSIKDNLVLLKFADGKQEYIPLVNISSMKVIEKVA